ncbi:MAG: DUF2089 domain-containing protein [Firmicutes bacterium]|nr:DUF2089 domain-containing protein [Bacillota bacterium]
MEVTRLRCETCDTAVEGHFDLCRFCRLTPEQKDFAELFLASRGNIREVERALGISYPTVRGRLEALIEALGFPVQRQQPEAPGSETKKGILDSLSRGEITADEAIKLLQG